MDSELKPALESALKELQQKTSVEIAVVSVKDFQGLDRDTYAVELFEKWGIGSKKTDEGVLVLLSVGDREIKVEVGYGCEGYLPDGLVGSIIDEKGMPAFRAGQLGGGLLSVSLALARTVAKYHGVELTGASGDEEEVNTPDFNTSQIVLIIIIVILYLIFFRGHGFYIGGGRKGGFGGFGGGSSGGFGGFGGGRSGGGGAGRRF